jgi:hypothetical protein
VKLVTFNFLELFGGKMAEEEFSDEFADLQRGDSNRSWRPASQGASTDDPPQIDRNRRFLVTLGTLMTLFR